VVDVDNLASLVACYCSRQRDEAEYERPSPINFVDKIYRATNNINLNTAIVLLLRLTYRHCPRVREGRSVQRHGVCPSVCFIRPLQQRAAGLLLWARQGGDIDRLLYGRCRRYSSTVPRNTAFGSKCGQCHVLQLTWEAELTQTRLYFNFML